jgi:hypothetical protein
VRLRLVRIGDSPLAPVFDVLERPNNWDRGLRKLARESAEPFESDAYKREFWNYFLTVYPDEASKSRAVGTGSRWRSPLPSGIFVGPHVDDDSIGVFLRGHRDPIQAVMRRLKPFKGALRTRLGVPIEVDGCSIIAGKKLAIDTQDRINWDQMTDWLHDEADAYEAALRGTLGAEA